MQKLKKALNTNGWDGRWYKRAFMDNGDVLGSLQNEECRIDSIAQAGLLYQKLVIMTKNIFRLRV